MRYILGMLSQTLITLWKFVDITNLAIAFRWSRELLAALYRIWQAMKQTVSEENEWTNFQLNQTKQIPNGDEIISKQISCSCGLCLANEIEVIIPLGISS